MRQRPERELRKLLQKLGLCPTSMKIKDLLEHLVVVLRARPTKSKEVDEFLAAAEDCLPFARAGAPLGKRRNLPLLRSAEQLQKSLEVDG